MKMKRRKTYTDEFKIKLVLEVLREEKTFNEMAQIMRKYKVKEKERQIDYLYRQIVELTAQLNWARKKIEELSELIFLKLLSRNFSTL